MQVMKLFKMFLINSKFETATDAKNEIRAH